MKKIAMGTMLAAFVLMAGFAYAGNGFGTGAWWMDGDDTSQGWQGLLSGSCLGDGTATGLGLGLGFGDGTQPQPLDGTGFGSPFAQ